MKKIDALCVVTLGRNGDIINQLPCLKLLAEQEGGKIHLMTTTEFLPLLGGCSYIEPVPVSFEVPDLLRALYYANRTFARVMNGQVRARGYQVEQCNKSFTQDAWKLLGFGERFGDESLKPEFDKRVPAREKNIIDCLHLRGKPVILATFRGVSVPFKQADVFRSALRKTFSNKYDYIDLDSIPVYAIYDFLGLIEKAAVLISIDTVFLHLAGATKIPVVALINNNPWCGSIPRSNVVERMLYREATILRVVDAVERVLNGRAGEK